MNLFYPPFVTYLPLLLKIFTTTYSGALKIFGALCIISSGITMYFFTYQVTKKRSIALFSAIFYLIAPYKLANVYKRFAIGEFAAMVFIPIVFLGLYNLFEQDKKKHYYIAIGAIGLMLTHTITTLYTGLFSLIYVLFNFRKLKKKDILIKCGINIIFILLVSMLFWMPLLEAKSQADYSILNDNIMKTYGDFAYENVISFSQLFKDKGEENGTTFLLGLPTIVAILLTIVAYKKVDEKYKSFYLICIIFALISLYMSSRFFPWMIMPNILCKLQYPWRMLGYFIFFISFVCGVNLYETLKLFVKNDILKAIIVLIFVILSIISSISIQTQFFIEDKTIDEKYEAYILKNPKIWHMSINRDYMPTKAILQQNGYADERNKNKTYILKGSVEIEEENKEELKDSIKIKNATQNTELEFPYFYYPGYKITLVNYVSNDNKEEIKLKGKESDNGYLSVDLQKNIETGEIKVEYVGTFITYFSYIASAISLVLFIGYVIWSKRND